MSEVLNVGVREVLNEYYDTPAEKQNRIKKQTHADGGTFVFDYTIAGGNMTETTMTSPNGAREESRVRSTPLTRTPDQP